MFNTAQNLTNNQLKNAAYEYILVELGIDFFLTRVKENVLALERLLKWSPNCLALTMFRDKNFPTGYIKYVPYDSSESRCCRFTIYQIQRPYLHRKLNIQFKYDKQQLLRTPLKNGIV